MDTTHKKKERPRGKKLLVHLLRHGGMSDEDIVKTIKIPEPELRVVIRGELGPEFFTVEEAIFASLPKPVWCCSCNAKLSVVPCVLCTIEKRKPKYVISRGVIHRKN